MLHHPIYFIRHGQTDWNAEGRLQGQKDIPLNATGRQQAKDAGAILADLLRDPSGWKLFCSPLGRTRETMELMAKAYHQNSAGVLPEPAFEDRLLEVTFGDYEGLTLDELKHENPAAHDARKSLPWTYQPPNGESYADGADRSWQWDLVQVIPMIIVSHGGICRGFRKNILGLSDEDAAQFHTPQGVVIAWSTDEAEALHHLRTD